MDALSPQSRSWSLSSMLLPAVAALPFAASLGFNAVDRLPRAPQKSEARPALVFDQYLVNLEEVRNQSKAEAQFSFKNCGKHPARITNLEPSCGCLNPQIEKRTYRPGETCDFSLSVLTTREPPGAREYELRIDYEDPFPRSATVAFKFNLSRQITVQPHQLLFYQGGNKETEQTVVVSDWRQKPLHVTGATCKSPLVKVKLGNPVDIPEGGRETSITVTFAAKVPGGKEDTTVVLTTDDPRFPKIPIFIAIRDINAPAAHKPSGGIADAALPQARH